MNPVATAVFASFPSWGLVWLVWRGVVALVGGA